jgi:imidazolonepropionase-like amidohydrolase
MTVLRSIASLDDPTFRSDPRLKYLPPSVRGIWEPIKDFRFKDRTAEDSELSRLVLKKQVEIIGRMRRAGVEFIAGTDTLNPFCFPGFSLHDELVLLAGAGLTPMEALQAATLNPARFLGKEKELGTVEKGKLADLVLLEANPLEDINNTRRINAVVVGGKLISNSEIQRMLATAEAAAGKK